MKKEYSVRDLFLTTWTDMKSRPRRHAEVYHFYQALRELDPATPQWGVLMIQVLRRVRKNPQLVDQITEIQAVDIFHDIERTMLSQPWYFFPELGTDVTTPDEQLARTTFDQFIYADKEFSLFVRAAWQKQPETELRRLLCRLTACIYQRKHRKFDPENVDHEAAVYQRKLHPWELQLIQFTYAHVRQAIVDRCPTLLPKGSTEAEPQSTGPMWAKIKHEVARTGVFGTFPQVGNARVYDVLDHLELLSKEAKETKRHAAA